MNFLSLLVNKNENKMRISLLILVLFALFTSCSNPDKIYIDKIEDHVREGALGMDMNYKSISFEWVDTLFVKDEISELEDVVSKGMDLLLNFEYFVKDNFEPGNIFSLSYITKDRLIELRNWEKNNRGIPFNEDYNDYYEFAFANRTASGWISELCDQIEKTDSLLNVYDKIENGDISLLKNVLWYYERIDNYESNNIPDRIWSTIAQHIDNLSKGQAELERLQSQNPQSVVHYKALNKYTINNPLFGGAEVQLARHFYFDKDFNIIHAEDFEDN